METQLLALLVLLAATNQLVSAMLRAMDRRISAPLIAIGTLLGRDSGIMGDPPGPASPAHAVTANGGRSDREPLPRPEDSWITYAIRVWLALGPASCEIRRSDDTKDVPPNLQLEDQTLKR